MTDNHGPELLACTVVFLVAMWAAVAARSFVRVKIIKNFALDDWLAVLVLLLMTAYAGVILAGVKVGCGQHQKVLKTWQKVRIMKLWYAGEIFYIVTTALGRIAVAAFLLRVAVRNVHRWIVYGGAAINLIFSVYFIFFTIFQCTPVEGFWTRIRGAQGVNCRSRMSVTSTFAASAIGAFIDWVFGLLPFFILWQTNLNVRKKVALGFVMGLGALASTAPLVRIPYTISLEHSQDFIFETVDVAIWSFAEPALMLIAISLAVLRPLFASLRNRSYSSRNGTKGTMHFRDVGEPKLTSKQSWGEEDESATGESWQSQHGQHIHHSATSERGGNSQPSEYNKFRDIELRSSRASTGSAEDHKKYPGKRSGSSTEKIWPKR